VQFVEDHFIESYYPTIENTFRKTIKLKGFEYECEILDTAGQVQTIMPPAYRVCVLACVLFEARGGGADVDGRMNTLY
jgi:GTPase SAR1 family protein